MYNIWKKPVWKPAYSMSPTLCHSGKSKAMETRSRSVVARSWGEDDKQESKRNLWAVQPICLTLFCSIDYAKAFDCVDHNKLWKILKEMEIPELLPLEKSVCWSGRSLEEGMITHSSILAWRISWTEEPGGLHSMGLQRVRHDWSVLAWCRSRRDS